MPVSKAAWLKLPKGQRGKLSYGQYVAWTRKTTANRLAAQDKLNQQWGPLMPLTDQQLRSQASATIRSQTQPVINEVSASIARARKAGVADINKSTAQSLAYLKPLAGELGSTYDYGIKQTQAGSQAIAGFLKGAGLKDQANLASQLSQAGLPGSSENFGTSGGLSGAQALGQGTSAMDLMIGNRATEVASAKKQPGFATRVGAANVSTLNRDYANKLADALGQIGQGVPGMVNTAYQSLLDREYNKAVARRGFQMDNQKLAASKQSATDAANNKRDAANQKLYNVDAQNSNNANDGFARNAQNQQIPDGQGGFVPWSKQKPKPGAAGPASKFQGRVDKAIKAAGAMSLNARHAMGAYLAPKPGVLRPHGHGELNKYISQQRSQIVSQLYSYWSQNFPGQTDAWVKNQVAHSLAVGGWKLDATQQGYAGPNFVPGKPQVGKEAPGMGPGANRPGAPAGPAAPGTTVPGGRPTATTGAAPSITGVSHQQRQRFLTLVTGRATALNKARTSQGPAGAIGIMEKYGLLSNYIMREAFGLGYGIQPAQAFALAQATLTQQGQMQKYKPLGNPKNWYPAYKIWTPHRG